MGTRKNGKIVYKISKDANLDKEIKIDNSKIQNSAERTKALTKEYKKSNRRAIKDYREKSREKSIGSSSSKRERASENYMRNATKSDSKKKKGYFSGVNFNLTPSGIKKALTEGNKNAREAFRVSAAAVSGDRKPLQQWEKENLNDVDRFVLGANTEWAGGVVRGAEWLGDVTGLTKEKNPEKRTGTRLLNESERYKSELKEGKSEAAKFALDLGSQLYLIGADLIVTGGRSALIPMAIRSFGTGVNEAYYSGANLAQQGAYGALNAGVEVATEKLWSAGSKFVNKKGVLDNLTEKTAKKISGAAKRFVKSDKGQDILYRAAKAGIGATEEGLEEAIADAVNPLIQRITYDEDALKQYGDPEYWSDMAYDAAIGAAAGGIMGGISQAAEYKRGKNMTREQQEAEIEKGLKSDESSESYSYANELLNQSQRGENILPGQFYDLAKKNAAADSRAAKQYNEIYTEALDNETFRKAQEGFDEEDAERAKSIAVGRESAAAETAKAVLLKQGVEETQADEYAQSIGRIVAGTAGYADTEVFQGNDAAKAAFQKVTGYALPVDNESTRRQATQYAANATYNLAVNMRADIETEIAAENGGSFRASDGTVVETPVMITSPADVATFRKSVRKYSGDTAQRLAADYTGTVSVGNYTGAFAAFYDAGKIAYTNPQRFNFTWANKINSAWRDFLTTGAARDAYLSGIKAARLAGEKKAAKTNITKKGESKAEDKSKKLSETQNDMAKALAEKTGLDITIAEKLQKVVAGTDVELNGAIDVAMGTLELSLDSDNLGQALAHELTHYVYALNEEGAKELRDAVLSWYAEEKGMKSLSELLENKEQMYGDEVIAEEEFVADALAGIFSNDKGAKSFAQWLTDKSGYSVEQQKSVLQKLIDVLDSIIANIKAMFTGNDLSKVSKDMRQLAKQNQKRAEAVRKIYVDALNKASESYKATEAETNANENGVKYSKKSENSSIRNQLRTNIDKLKDMRPVANVKYESMKHLSRSQKAEAIMKDFDKKFKGGIERQGFGFIVLRKDEVTDSLKYLYTDAEFAAFKALPQLLKRGKIIGRHVDHKKRNFDTVTIAAPVTINGTEGYMAAAVKVGGENRYHVHRILMPDGSEFEFNKKTEPTGAGMTASKGRQGSAISSAFDNRVSETDKKSNGKFSMKEKSIGYHAGDLGKSESLWNQSGGRDTGHFGTGTYFVGNKEKIKGYNMRDGKEAPTEEVDFSNYNLFKPENTADAYRIHDFLKGINEYYNTYGFGTLDEDSLQELMVKADSVIYDMDEGNISDDEAREFLETVWTGRDYEDATHDDIREELWKLRDDRSWEIMRLGKVVDFNETIPEMSHALGISKDEFLETITDIENNLNNIVGYKNRSVHDSASTMFMKSLGYEGIDVRHTNLDNTAYGSVIYDLKGKDAERKAEIGTARFSMKEPVEESGNLIAVHNIRANELLKTIELGGFAMPSIAVTKADMGHNMYGDISVLFSKDTINPEVSKYNKVYSGDAYTPEFPRIDFEIDSKAASELQNRIKQIIGSDLDGSGWSPYLDTNNLEDKINREDGNFVEAYRGNTALMYAFMKEREGSVGLPQKEKPFSHNGKYTNEQVRKFAKLISEEKIDDIYSPNSSGMYEYYENNPELVEQIREMRNKDFRKKHKEAAEKYAENNNGKELEFYREVSFADFDNLLGAIRQYYKEGETLTADIDELRDIVIMYAVYEHNEDYLKWLADISDGIIAGRGVRNNKELFTSGGNRRTFKQLHDEANLVNIVKSMRSAAQTGGTSFGEYDFMGSAVREYTSIDDIRSDSSRLTLEDEGTYHDYVDEIMNGVRALAERLKSSSYVSTWDIQSCIAEAVAKRKTKSGIRNFLESELVIPDYVDMNEVADEIVELRDRAQHLPTGYFEAKPQRAIGFNEVKAVIAPDIMNAELRAAITDAGMELYEYKAGNEEDRLAKVNEAAESKQLRFSVKEDSKGNTLSAEQQEYFKDSKARDENGRLAVVYHGTPVAGFTVFNRNQNYYSDSEELAGTYTNNEGMYEGYLNITNPLVVDARNEKFSGIPVDYIEVDNLEELMDISGLSPFEEDGMMRTSTADIAAMVEDARDEEMVNYDGVIFRNVYDEGGYSNADVGTIKSNVYVTFRSNQFKNIDNKTPTDSPDIRYSVKEDGVKHFSITKKDILDNMKAVSEMDPVEYLAGNEFAKSNVDLVTQVEEYYSSIGGFAENDILGDVELNRNGVKSSIGHGIGRNKAIAFKAVPEVIASGKIIDVQRNRKDRGYDTVVIAAPVSIADSDYYVGVVVTRDLSLDKQSYYLHEAGIAERSDMPSKTVATQKGSTHGGNTASLLSLLQQLNDVNMISENDIVSSEGRFSIKETSRSEEKLLRENKKYKRLVTDLKQQMRLSKGRIPDKGEINRYANRLRTEYKSKADKEQLVNALTNLYGYMADKNANPGQVWDVARSIANDIIKNSAYNREITDYAKGILEDIKSSKVALSETQKQEVAYVYGSYAEYKRSNKGVNASDNGIYLDQKWQEWAEVYPELFDAELVEPDQGVRLAEITKALSEDYVNEFGFDLADATDMLAAEIANEVSQAREMVTFADRKKQQQADKVAREKAKNREKINTIKQQYKEKYQQQMAEQRAKNNQKLTDQRDKAKEQLARQKAKYEQRMADTRARADRRGVKTQIEKDVKYLTGMLLSPTDTKHIPEGYQSAIARMLAGFDFSTTRTDAWTKKYGHLSRRMLNFAHLKSELENIAKKMESGIVVDDFIIELADKLREDLDGRRLDSLTNEELQNVKTLLKAVRYGISNINSTFSDNIKQTRAEAGDKIIEETRQIKDKKNKDATLKMFDDFLNSSNVKPVDFFEIMGGTAKEVFGAVVDGFDRHIRNVDTAMKYIQGAADGKTLKRLSNEKARPVKFNLSSGEAIELMPSQVMSLYCLMKRPQAMNHILKGGVVPTSLRYKKKLKTQGIINSKRKQISYTDALMIINSLSEEEKTIADKLQKFMADNCAAWGNETSMRLYGYKKFDEADYFPIKSDANFLESRQTDKAELMPKLWTAGFTKKLDEKANNPIMLDDIFDVVTRHITEMSMYNALAPALLDFERIYNYKQRAADNTYYNGTTVKEQIGRAYGDKATNYIETLLRDLNNANKRKDKVDTAIPNKLLANYKKAKMDFNFRVLIQQPTAIVRSAIMINPKYLIAAQGKPAVKEMQEHCPIAKWKGWGFYQTDVAPSMKEIILGQESRLDKLFMNAYGKADDLTWSYIWKAVKKEVKANNPDIEVGSQEYWNKCNERARDIFYRTQVVDSMLSRSQIMRNDQVFTKMVTSFMAEPTTTFNMMRTETIKTAKEWAAGEKKAATKRMSTLIPVFIANAAAVSAAAAVADYLRDAYTGDDDDEEETQTPLQKYLKYTTLNMLDNANPLNMLPFTRDIYSLYSGYDITRMDMAAFTTMYKDIERLQKTYEQGEDAKYTYEYGIRQLLLHSAEIFGVPLANIVREGETVIKTAFPNGEAILDSFMYNNPNEVNRKSNYAALLSDDTEKSGKALEAIKEDAESRYQEYIDKGKSESQAMSAVRSSLSSYYKGAYQAADTSERSMIVNRISQITVNGRSVWEYADGSIKDFSEWGEQ